jgi:hypothetical protein
MAEIVQKKKMKKIEREGEGFEEEKWEKLKGPSTKKKKTKIDWEKEKEAAIADISPPISLVFPFFFF